MVATNPVAPIDCKPAKSDPAATEPIPDCIPAATDPPAIPALVNPTLDIAPLTIAVLPPTIAVPTRIFLPVFDDASGWDVG